MAQRIERVLAALEGKEPDRVPVMDVMEEYGNIYEILKRKPLPLGYLFTNSVTSRIIDKLGGLINRSGIFDYEMASFAYDRTEASVKMGYDATWVQHVPIWRFRNSSEATDIYGRYYNIVLDGKGNLATPMYRGGLISGRDDWNALDKSPILKMPDKANKVFKKIQRDFGSDIFVFASFLYGLFENSWQPMGFERFVLTTRKDRELIDEMIKFYEDHYCLMLEAWADAGVPGVIYTDDMAYRSGPMLNPKLMEELYGKAFRRITKTAHKLGMKIVVHSCGRVYDLLEWFADCGFDGVHALEPTAGVELAKAKEMVGDRLCLFGNVDITRILVDAPKDEVFEAVRESIEAAGKGGGYVVAPTNSHQAMSIERLGWMIEATEKYGKYPLAKSN